MDNLLPIFDEIQYKELRPWLPAFQHDEMFEEMLSEIKLTPPQTSFHFKMDFYRPFNNKTTYYHKLLTNETDKCSSAIITLISNKKDIKVRKYLLDLILKKVIKSRLSDLGNLIKDRHLDISYINPKTSTFDIDPDHKSDTYIIHLLKVCYIKIFLEIQQVFKDLRPTLLIPVDFYTQLIHEPVPDNLFITEIQPPISIEGVEEQSVPPNPTPKDISLMSFTYKGLAKESDKLNDLHDNLKKNNFIAKDTTLVNFKKVFSGKEITNPIIWTGNQSEFYYFIQLIYTKYKLVEDMRQKQWKVACMCFILPDGTFFDKDKLRRSKIPKSTKHMIEHAVDLLK